MTKECAKQVEAATAEYEIEIAELKLYKHDSQIRAQASDREIQQLKEQNIVLTNALVKAGLL